MGKKGPQTQGTESQTFFHGLLIDPLFCFSSQFQFLSLKTKEFNCQGSKKHRLSELLDPTLSTFFPTETAPALVTWEITPGRMLKDNRVTQNLKLMTRYAHRVEG